MVSSSYVMKRGKPTTGNQEELFACVAFHLSKNYGSLKTSQVKTLKSKINNWFYSKGNLQFAYALEITEVLANFL